MIITYADLPGIRLKNSANKIVLASGVFDLLHMGHLHYLQSLKGYGEINVVLIKPDSRVRRLKGPDRPIIPERDRAIMVNSIKGVDYVIIGHDLPTNKVETDSMYEEILRILQPDIFVTNNSFWKILDGISRTQIVVNPRKKYGHFDSTTAILAHINKLVS